MRGMEPAPTIEQEYSTPPPDSGVTVHHVDGGVSVQLSPEGAMMTEKRDCPVRGPVGRVTRTAPMAMPSEAARIDDERVLRSSIECRVIPRGRRHGNAFGADRPRESGAPLGEGGNAPRLFDEVRSRLNRRIRCTSRSRAEFFSEDVSRPARHSARNRWFEARAFPTEIQRDIPS